MDEKRFDAWTRRRFGLTGGLAVFAVRLGSMTPVAAKKKRCKKLGDECTPGGKRKCCGDRKCGEVAGSPGFFCCKKPHKPCSVSTECCGNRVCGTIDSKPGTYCCSTLTTTSCKIDDDCCTGFACFEGFCKAT